MEKGLLRDIAESQMPDVTPEIVVGSYRWNVIDGLSGDKNLGIELGVAAGSFSAKMVASGKFARFWGVDMYADSHNTNEYKAALRLVGLDQNYHLLRMTFDQAIDLFPDGHFDFIYVDGYAHTGEEGGRTLLNWYRQGIEPATRLNHLSTFLGHVNPTSTAVYLTITSELFEQANQRFEKFAPAARAEVQS